MTTVAPKTQAELEELLANPEKMKDAIRASYREGLEADLADARKQIDAERAAAMDEIAKAAQNATAPKMAERPTPSGIPVETADGSIKGAWSYDDPRTGKMAIRREARGLNGEFESLGEFAASFHPEIEKLVGRDSRLKALGESAGGDGGFLVPDEFSAELFRLQLEESIVRPRARRVPMTSLTQRWPAIRDTSHATNVYGGVSASWLPEVGTYSSSQPTFGQIMLTAKKLTGYTAVSNELLADSAIALEALIRDLFPSAIAYFEDDAFVNGVGGGQPVGLLNAGALVTVSKESGQAAATIVKENIDKMYARMLPSSRNRAYWLANPDVIPELLSLSATVGTGGAPVMVMNIMNTPSFVIYGRPVLFSEKCQTLGTAGDLFFVDFSYYLIGDRMALEMAASPHVLFTTDQTVYRFTERVDGRPWLDTALTPRNGTNTLSPFVNLATRS